MPTRGRCGVSGGASCSRALRGASRASRGRRSAAHRTSHDDLYLRARVRNGDRAALRSSSRGTSVISIPRRAGDPIDGSLRSEVAQELRRVLFVARDAGAPHIALYAEGICAPGRASPWCDSSEPRHPQPKGLGEQGTSWRAAGGRRRIRAAHIRKVYKEEFRILRANRRSPRGERSKPAPLSFVERSTSTRSGAARCPSATGRVGSLPLRASSWADPARLMESCGHSAESRHHAPYRSQLHITLFRHFQTRRRVGDRLCL